MKKLLILLILCLIGTMPILTAQEAPILPAEKNAPAKSDSGVLSDGYDKFPECRLYFENVIINLKGSNFKEVFEKIGELTSVAAFYDKNSTKFDVKQNAGPDVTYSLLVWDGYISIKKAGTYTFLVTMSGMNPPHGQYGAFGLKVKDQPLIAAHRAGNLQDTLNVELKPGMNQLRFAVYCSPNAKEQVIPRIRYKLSNAIDDYRDLTPSQLFHQVIDEAW